MSSTAQADQSELTISATLAVLGYGHRKAAGCDNGQREIFHAATGAVVGFYRAEQAIAAAEIHAKQAEA